MPIASERNKRRALRRQALRLRMRRNYLKDQVIDGPDLSIDQMIRAVRSNRGRLPPGLVADPALARQVEQAVLLPFSLVTRAMQYRTW